MAERKRLPDTRTGNYTSKAGGSRPDKGGTKEREEYGPSWSYEGDMLGASMRTQGARKEAGRTKNPQERSYWLGRASNEQESVQRGAEYGMGARRAAKMKRSGKKR